MCSFRNLDLQFTPYTREWPKLYVLKINLWNKLHICIIKCVIDIHFNLKFVASKKKKTPYIRKLWLHQNQLLLRKVDGLRGRKYWGEIKLLRHRLEGHRRYSNYGVVIVYINYRKNHPYLSVQTPGKLLTWEYRWNVMLID